LKVKRVWFQGRIVSIADVMSDWPEGLTKGREQ
jgi:hypothetical protein